MERRKKVKKEREKVVGKRLVEVGLLCHVEDEGVR
jgi:hypothetical protein